MCGLVGGGIPIVEVDIHHFELLRDEITEGVGENATFTAIGEGVGPVGIDGGTVIFKDLKIVEGIELTAEEYAIGIRLEDTELLAKINAAIDEMVQDGSLGALAEKYGLADVYAFKK